MRGDVVENKQEFIVEEVPNLYRVIALHPLRRTANVSFDVMAESTIPKVDAIDRVIHESSAVSPGPVGGVEFPWYMHPHQDDNLMVLDGVRYVDLYSVAHGTVETFEIHRDLVKKNGVVIFEGPAMLVWPRGVFHRVLSGETGSASVNLATHYDGFDIKTNFNIYDVDTEVGTCEVIRYGHKDQQ